MRGIGNRVEHTGDLKVTCQLECSAERSKPVEKTRIGICQHSYARDALAAAGAVDAAAGAVRNPGRQNVDAVEVTVPVRVVAVCARLPMSWMGRKMIWQTFHSISLPTKRDIAIECSVRIYGG